LVLRLSYWAANLDIFGACHYNTTLSAIPANNGPGIPTPEVSRTPPFFFLVNVSQLALESVRAGQKVIHGFKLNTLLMVLLIAVWLNPSIKNSQLAHASS
jgi:hypothetical protein